MYYVANATNYVIRLFVSLLIYTCVYPIAQLIYVYVCAYVYLGRYAVSPARGVIRPFGVMVYCSIYVVCMYYNIPCVLHDNYFIYHSW